MAGGWLKMLRVVSLGTFWIHYLSILVSNTPESKNVGMKFGRYYLETAE